MPGESQQVPHTGAPDPSTRTVEQQASGLESERDWTKGQLEVISTRLDAMDKATIVLNETVTRTPTEIQKEVSHLRELAFAEIEAIRREQALRESHRLELKVDSEKALNAALAAAEKARDQQSIATQLAADKTERTFTESLRQTVETITVGLSGVRESVDDLKLSMQEVRSEKKGGGDAIRAIYAFAGFMVSLIIIGGLLAATGAFGN